MARTVSDLRILFEVMAGPCAGDPLSAPVPVRNECRTTLQDLRIGVLESRALGSTTPETQREVKRAGSLLATQGFQVEPCRMNNLDAALQLWWFFFGPVIARLVRQDTAGQESLLSPILKKYLESAADGPAVNLESFIAACNERDAIRTDILDQLHDIPILLSAVSSASAFPHGSGTYRPGDPYNYRDTMRFCQWLNLTGFPGLSLPMGYSPEGLPINIQLIARPYEEDLLLHVAQSLEQARGPWQSPSLP
jgi:Asp-tRNA(Asn)/Glu-tRNA(Gln) amidotransferase A subunit family amidase